MSNDYADYNKNRTDEVLAEIKNTEEWAEVQDSLEGVLKAFVYYLVSKGVIK